ncbi:FAD-binding domain-containing protein [Corynespora cassiicola Philippines]|uniref:FAD-binding domain-containing protein n=1 Tax=Corynespora cassiicola Philippines TaxID=1448308 RepID=A0A2T2P7F7_CORCC|nr:FAD-binding domain-containing protein [Corynespora cassiicola Philippines]
MSVAKAISVVKAISADIVVSPEDQIYDDITKSYFTGLNRDLKPAAYLVPSLATQVADIVKAIKPFAQNLKIAVAGAGQQATPKVSNVSDGLTIHLRKLLGVEVDKEKKTVSVAAGEKWGNVYDKVMALGFGVVGQRHSTGGIGGDAIQAGLSYFSYSRGFVSDNVVGYEVVLASGEIVNANAEDNCDLWTALKGGGNNFGIVTRYHLNIFEQGDMWGGKVFYFQPSFSGQIQSLVDYLHDPKSDTDVHICVSLGYSSAIGDHLCMNDIFSLKPQKPKALEPFADVQPQIDQMNSLRVESLKGLTEENFGKSSSRLRTKFTTTVKADVSILEYAVQTYRLFFKKIKRIANIPFSITFEPIPVQLISQSIARSGNAMGLKPSDGPLVIILFYASWDSAEEDENVIEVAKEALEKIETEAKSMNVHHPWLYLNYAFPHQDPIGSYGAENRAQLQAVGKKYDPECFFQLVCAEPFKLDK